MIQYKDSKIGNTTDTFFVINNPIGITGDFINATMQTLMECQINQIYFLTNYQNYLTIMASGVLFFSFIGIMIASVSADHSINYLWERLRKKTQCAYVELSQNIITRINEYHEYCDAIPMRLDPSQCKKSKPLTYRYSLRFFMNFFPFFIIAGGLYSVLVLVEFETIHILLEKEPQLIYSIYQARLCIPKIYFLTTESILSQQNYSLGSIYNGFLPAADLNITDISMINTLNVIKKLFYEPGIQPLLSSQDFSKLFRIYPNSTIYMDFGVMGAISVFRIESSFILGNNIAISSYDRSTYLSLTNDVTQSLSDLSSSIYAFSSNYMQGLLTSFLVYVCAFCIGHIMIYLLYYGPLLTKEEKILKTLKQLMEYIPSATFTKNSKSSGVKIIAEETPLL